VKAEDRETAFTNLTAIRFGKESETEYLNVTSMQNFSKAKRWYQLIKIVLAEQERFEVPKRELNRAKPEAEK
jgi:hypothetical protein